MKSPKQLIDELHADGFTQARIAKLTDVTQATISRMQSGLSEGRAATLCRLLEVHRRHFSAKSNKKSSAAVPVASEAVH